MVFIALDALEAGSPGEFVGHFAPEGVSDNARLESEAVGGIADAVGAAHGVNEGDERVGFAAAVLGAEADDSLASPRREVSVGAAWKGGPRQAEGLPHQDWFNQQNL